MDPLARNGECAEWHWSPWSSHALPRLRLLPKHLSLEPAEPPGAEPASGWPAPPLLALPSTARPAGRKASELGPDALVALCQDLRDEGATHFPGNAVEQAQAAAAHAEQRQAALSTSYVAVVPSGGFAFRDYAMGEHNLVLDTARSFVLGEGAELFVAASDSPPTFPLSPDIALRLLAEHGAGHLVLRLVFRAAPSQIRKDGCMWLSGGHVVKMEVDLIGAALFGPMARSWAAPPTANTAPPRWMSRCARPR